MASEKSCKKEAEEPIENPDQKIEWIDSKRVRGAYWNLLGPDNNIEFLKHLWIFYWKNKVQRGNMAHFKAFNMKNLKYEIRIW